MKKINPIVTVVITSKNEVEVIGRLLSSLKKQSFKNFEVILVDNNSTDGTVEIANSFDLKIFNFGPERSAQRNFGAKKAKGKYLLFLDADMELTKDVIKDCLVKVKLDERIGGLMIPEESIPSNFWERVKAFERSFYNLSGDMTDAARFFPKKTFLSLGGYDEILTGPEDWDLTDRVLKSGYKCDRIKALIYHYERVPSLFILAKKKFYYALSSYKYLKKQEINFLNPRIIYFLRPVFYKKWKRLVYNPKLTLGMFFMFLLQLISGGLGYLIGRFRK